MENKQERRVALIGATTNTSRYAYFAAELFNQYKVEFVPLGIKTGEVFGNKILDIRTFPAVGNIDTITLYLGPKNQLEYYEYLISLKPNRIIFNPGTENFELSQLAQKNNIVVQEACTLVMLRLGNFNQYQSVVDSDAS